MHFLAFFYFQADFFFPRILIAPPISLILVIKLLTTTRKLIEQTNTTKTINSKNYGVEFIARTQLYSWKTSVRCCWRQTVNSFFFSKWNHNCMVWWQFYCCQLWIYVLVSMDSHHKIKIMHSTTDFNCGNPMKLTTNWIDGASISMQATAPKTRNHWRLINNHRISYLLTISMMAKSSDGSVSMELRRKKRASQILGEHSFHFVFCNLLNTDFQAREIFMFIHFYWIGYDVNYGI